MGPAEVRREHSYDAPLRISMLGISCSFFVLVGGFHLVSAFSEYVVWYIFLLYQNKR